MELALLHRTFSTGCVSFNLQGSLKMSLLFILVVSNIFHSFPDGSSLSPSFFLCFRFCLLFYFSELCKAYSWSYCWTTTEGFWKYSPVDHCCISGKVFSSCMSTFSKLECSLVKTSVFDSFSALIVRTLFFMLRCWPSQEKFCSLWQLSEHRKKIPITFCHSLVLLEC